MLKTGCVKGVCTQRSRKAKVHPVNGIRVFGFVPILRDVVNPILIRLRLAIDLPIPPLCGPPVLGNQEGEFVSDVVARTINYSVIMKPL